MITLGTIKTEMASFMVNQFISSRVPEWTYWVMKDILKTPSKFWWNKKKTTLTTADGTSEYFLNHRVNGSDIIWMGDEDRPGFEIKKKSLEEIYGYVASVDEEGDPVFWALVNQVEVQASNTATTASAVSSSASDSAQIVIIKGLSSNIERYESISLNGTTTATATSPITWTADSVYSVSLSAACTGTVTVTIGSAIAVIPPGVQRIQCPRIRLWRVPGDTYTLPYIYYQKAMKPVADGDIIDIPDEGFDCLLKGLFYWGHKNNGDTGESVSSWNEYQRAKADFISWSQHEPRKIDQKYWGRNTSEVPYSLPRIISATVT